MLNVTRCQSRQRILQLLDVAVSHNSVNVQPGHQAPIYRVSLPLKAESLRLLLLLLCVVIQYRQVHLDVSGGEALYNCVNSTRRRLV